MPDDAFLSLEEQEYFRAAKERLRDPSNPNGVLLKSSGPAQTSKSFVQIRGIEMALYAPSEGQVHDRNARYAEAEASSRQPVFFHTWSEFVDAKVNIATPFAPSAALTFAISIATEGLSRDDVDEPARVEELEQAKEPIYYSNHPVRLILVPFTRVVATRRPSTVPVYQDPHEYLARKQCE